jgi:hypothetical protein
MKHVLESTQGCERTTVPHASMIVGNQMEGRSFFNIMLLGTSKNAYLFLFISISLKKVNVNDDEV